MTAGLIVYIAARRECSTEETPHAVPGGFAGDVRIRGEPWRPGMRKC